MTKIKNINTLLIGGGVLLLSSFIIMLLWNCLMPVLFGLIKISYWQAVVIRILYNNLTGFE